MYEEIVNIPFIVRWPNVAPNHTVTKELISHIDVTPTILEFFNLTPSKVLEGKSIIKMLKSPSEKVRDSVFIEFGRFEIDHDTQGGFQPIRCIRSKHHKLIINLLSSDEFYDLDVDPEEMTNLIESEKYTEIRNRLHIDLLQWMDNTRDPFRGYYWQQRPWRKDVPPPTWQCSGMTRQREEDEEYEPRQLDYNTGLSMEDATRKK
jgi:uncharacterized sulfatase